METTTTHGLLPHAHDTHDEARREEQPAKREEDDLAPARGILVSMVVGGGLWALLLTAGWLIFR